jgi:hypothetical protein
MMEEYSAEAQLIVEHWISESRNTSGDQLLLKKLIDLNVQGKFEPAPLLSNKSQANLVLKSKKEVEPGKKLHLISTVPTIFTEMGNALPIEYYWPNREKVLKKENFRKLFDSYPYALSRGRGPQDVIHDTLDKISNKDFRIFLENILQLPLVNAMMVLKCKGYTPIPRYGFECLRDAGIEAIDYVYNYSDMLYVIFVATILIGCRDMIQATNSGPSTANEILLQIVSPGLKKLNVRESWQVSMIRRCLGWETKKDVKTGDVTDMKKIIQLCLDRSFNALDYDEADRILDSY